MLAKVLNSAVFGIDAYWAGLSCQGLSPWDSKSREPKAHVGSIPTSGTNYINKLEPFVGMISGMLVRRI
jgi:hypothetical protein